MSGSALGVAFEALFGCSSYVPHDLFLGLSNDGLSTMENDETVMLPQNNILQVPCFCFFFFFLLKEAVYLAKGV